MTTRPPCRLLSCSRWCRKYGCWGGCGAPFNKAIPYAEFIRRPKWLRICQKLHLTKFMKFLLTQQLTKSNFIREFLSLFISCLLLTCNMLVFKFAVCSCAKLLLITIRYMFRIDTIWMWHTIYGDVIIKTNPSAPPAASLFCTPIKDTTVTLT